MTPALAKKLEQSLDLRQKLQFLSNYIHVHLLPQRKHHQKACKVLETHLLMHIKLIESDAILKNPEQYTSKAFSQCVIERRKLENIVKNHLRTTAEWAYSIVNKAKG